MAKFVDLFLQHQVLGTFIASTIWTAVISSLEAPTKDSGGLYVFFFKFLNSLAGNIKRAQSTAIEKSPNFLDAVEKIATTPPNP